MTAFCSFLLSTVPARYGQYIYAVQESLLQHYWLSNLEEVHDILGFYLGPVALAKVSKEAPAPKALFVWVSRNVRQYE